MTLTNLSSELAKNKRYRNITLHFQQRELLVLQLKGFGQ